MQRCMLGLFTMLFDCDWASMSLGALGTQGRLYKSFRRLWGDLVGFSHTQVLSVPGSWLVVSSFPFPLVADVLNRIPACNGRDSRDNGYSIDEMPRTELC